MPKASDNVKVIALYATGAFSGTGVDKSNNWLGSTFEDSNITDWVAKGINRIYISNTNYIGSTSPGYLATTYSSSGKAKLKTFINKCTTAGIDVGVVAGIAYTDSTGARVQNLAGIQRVVDYNSGALANEQIKYVVTEEEYWNTGNMTYAQFLAACAASYALLNPIGVALDVYIVQDAANQVVNLIPYIDTFWLTVYQNRSAMGFPQTNESLRSPSISKIAAVLIQIYTAAPATPVKIGALVSCESYELNKSGSNSTSNNFMGYWLEGKELQNQPVVNNNTWTVPNPKVTSEKSLRYLSDCYTHNTLNYTVNQQYLNISPTFYTYVDWQGVNIFDWKILCQLNIANDNKDEVWAVGNGAISATNIANLPVAQQVAALVPSSARRFLYLGDVYSTGSQLDFTDATRSYDKIYGTQAPGFRNLNQLTSATIGHVDWLNAYSVGGYIDYWTGLDAGQNGVSIKQWDGGRTAETNLPYYSFYVEGWKFICINSMQDGYPNGGVSTGSTMYNWLVNELSDPGVKKIVYCHHPRWSGDNVYGDNPDMQPLWAAMQGHAFILLSAHVHNYQRHYMRNTTGQIVSSGGVYQINVATGGDDLYGWDLGYTDINGINPIAYKRFGYGALRMRLSNDCVDLAFIDNNGVVKDAVSLCTTALAPNVPPTIDAGPGQTIPISTTTLVTATATDDGYPVPPGSISYQWSALSGPGTVTFANPTLASTQVSFSDPGTYVLQVQGYDGEFFVYDTVTIIVTPVALYKTITVDSVNPNSGVSITCTPDLLSTTSVTTSGATLSYSNTTVFVLTAPSTAGGNVFWKWQRDGSDFCFTTDATEIGVGDHTFTAVYQAPPPPPGSQTRLVVVSSNDPTATFTASVADITGVSSGTIGSQSLLYPDGTTVTFTFSGTTSPAGNPYSGSLVYPPSLIPYVNPSTSVTITVTGGTYLISASYSTTLSANIYTSWPACDLSSTSSILAYPGGGTGPYTYDWQINGGGPTLYSAFNFSGTPGTYQVTITDSTSPTPLTKTFTDLVIGLIDPIIPNANVLDAKCINGLGSISLSPTGGLGDGQFGYSWSNGSNQSSITDVAGLYTVTIFNSTPAICPSVFSYTIGTPGAISVLETYSNPSCPGVSNGVISLSISGGTNPINIYWEKDGIALPYSSPSLTNLSAGLYFYSVTDALGCQVTGTINLYTPALITYTATGTDCTTQTSNDGQIEFTLVSGGSPAYNYSIDGGVTQSIDPLFLNLSPGSYSCVIIDSYGCFSSVRNIFISTPFGPGGGGNGGGGNGGGGTNPPSTDADDQQEAINSRVSGLMCCLGKKIANVFKAYNMGHNNIECLLTPVLTMNSMMKTVRTWYPSWYSFNGSKGYMILSGFDSLDSTKQLVVSFADSTLFVYVPFAGASTIQMMTAVGELFEDEGFTYQVDGENLWVYSPENSYYNGLPITLITLPVIGSTTPVRGPFVRTTNGFMGASDICYASNILTSSCISEEQASDMLNQIKCSCNG
jgi:hypothetical protein